MKSDKKQHQNIALVLAVSGMECILKDENGKQHKAVLKGNLKLQDTQSTSPIVVGDYVYFQYTNTAFVHIVKIKDRDNYVIRESVKLAKRYHIMAANIDLIAIVICIKSPRVPPGFIDRYLLMAKAYGIGSILIFTKLDTWDSAIKKQVNSYHKLYSDLGYKIFKTSTLSGNIDGLKNYLNNKKTFFTGFSGVGKSSLINALIPGLTIKTMPISIKSLKGQHCTSLTQSYLMNQNTLLIDSPGIKEFGLVDIQKNELANYFPEMLQRLSLCKYKNCKHVWEKDCEVKKAVEQEEIALSRYESYLSLYLEKERGDKKIIKKPFFDKK